MSIASAATSQATRAIASPASRHTFSAIAGGGTAIGLATHARNSSDPPDADGSSYGHMDRAEARDKFSGPSASTTILPLAIAFLAIGGLYTKGRILLPESGARIPAALQDAARAAGTELVPGEGSLTKMLYAYSGGMIFGSFGARELVFGDDDYETRHVPVDGNGSVVAPARAAS